MINKARESSIEAKHKIMVELSKTKEIPCIFMKGRNKTKGFILTVNQNQNAPLINVRSHTGKEYSVLITSFIDINGIDEL